MLNLPRISGARIVATSLALPDVTSDGSSARFTNERLVRTFFREGRRGPRSDEELDEFAANLGQRTGVTCRYWSQIPSVEPGAPPNPSALSTVDLQERAVRQVLEAAGARVSDLSALVTATSTPAYAMTPNCRVLVERLGARCAAIDLRNGCGSGIYALNQGFYWAAASRGLVVVTASDTFSRVMRGKAMLATAGDAGAAILIGPDDDQNLGIEAAVLDSYDEPAAVRSRGRLPPMTEDLEADRYALSPNAEDMETYVASLVRALTGSSKSVLHNAGLKMEDVDLVVPHQGGLEQLQALQRALDVDDRKWFSNLERFGNVGATSIYVCLHELRERLPGHRILLASVGGGLTWGATLLRC